ncbi:MAG: hypothetical protein N4A50_04470 [Vallitalea sp.]|nr:hypothetical protein [Vallitalea sp.]
MKRLNLIFTIITVILIICACHSASTNNEIVNLLKEPNLELSDQLIKQFFEYYNSHRFELSLLPPFNSSNQPDWNQLTLYTYLNFADNKNQDYDSKISKEEFRNTINKYFGQMEYIDKKSEYLKYVNETYICNPGDTMRTVYYRLTSITKDNYGLYTASFDGLFLEELEASELYEFASPNIKAIRDVAGTKEYMQTEQFTDTLLNIFLKDDYNKILDMTEKITIQFILTDNDIFPFVYNSCEIISY